MKVNFIFAWFDFWVGLYWDRDRAKLYLFLIPMLGIVFSFKIRCNYCNRWGWPGKEVMRRLHMCHRCAYEDWDNTGQPKTFY